MIGPETDKLQELLIDWIAGRALQHGQQPQDSARVAAAVRKVLEEPQLSAGEESRAVDAAKGFGDPINLVLGMRLERALQAGLEASADASRGLQAPPALFVVRDGHTLPDKGLVDSLTQTLAGTLPGTLPGSLTSAGEVPCAVIVLAEKEAFATLEKQADSLAEAMPTITFSKASKLDPQLEEGATALVQVDQVLPTIAHQARDFLESKGLPTTPEDPMIGRVFAKKYEIQKCIGRGGFGSVYKARHTLADISVAIKVLTPPTSGSEQRKAAFQRQLDEFVEEARRLVKLEHENIVNWKVFDQNEDGTYFFVMELLEGEELEDLLNREKRLSPKRVASIMLQVLAALRIAHRINASESILHLDLKPKNIFHMRQRRKGDPDRIKVIDFGIGQVIERHDRKVQEGRAAQESESVPAVGAAKDSNQTRQLLGTERPTAGINRCSACTPEYASPEQCAHMLKPFELQELGVQMQPLDGRSDLYSLGVMGFQLLTGELPIKRPKQRRELLKLHIKQEPQKLSKMGLKVPRPLANFIDQCLIKDRDKRWANSEEAFQALNKIVRPPIGKKLALIGIPLLLASIGVTWALGGGEAPNRFKAPSGPLYAGPEQPQILLETLGLPAQQVGLPAILVSDPADLANQLPWTTRWEGQNLYASPQAGAALESSAFLVLDPESANPWTSDDSFDLIHLPPGSVEAAQAFVPKLGLRAADPIGLFLEIRVRGREADIDKVEVHPPSQTPKLASVEPSELTDGLAHYRIGLDKLDLADGPHTVEVRVWDRAGAETSLELPLRIANGPLKIERAYLEGVTPYGNRYSISPDSKPILKVQLNRSASVDWQVLQGSGDTVLTQGRKEGVMDIAVPLDLAGSKAYQGTIRIQASDANSVLHADSSPYGQPLPATPLAFEYNDSPPSFLAKFSGAGQNISLELDSPPQPIFINHTKPRIEIVLKETSPVLFEMVELDTGRVAQSNALTDPAQRSWYVDVALAGEGLHAYEIRGFPCDPQSQVKLGEPVRIPLQFVVDNSAPKLRVSGASELVMKQTDWEVPPLMLGVEDFQLPATPTPVQLNWRLIANDKEIRRGTWDDLASPAADIPIQLDNSTRGAATDGNYELHFSGVDLAGNRAEEATFRWQVAFAGPDISLDEPNAFADWDSDPNLSTQRFLVRVRADDPNGVASASCSITDTGDSSHTEAIALELERQDEFAYYFKGYFDLRSDWSEREVLLQFQATDMHGQQSSPAQATRKLVLIEDYAPARIALRLRKDASVELNPMCLVRGNRNESYIWSGRADSTENRLFKEAFKSIRYNTKEATLAWAVEFEPGQIADFYLDQNEVTVGQYLDFLESPDGYLNPSNWNAGTTPKAQRKQALREQLRTQSAKFPVTQVNWDEAAAYAHWVGKRLPSVVEWEFAVRGGTQWRPFSAYNGEQNTDPSPLEFNYDNRIGGAAWPTDRGRDLTQDTGLANLCSNVSEWSLTPQLFVNDSSKTPKDQALENPAWLLNPSLGPNGFRAAQKFWVMGGSFFSSSIDFSAITPRSRNYSRAHVGFRCAVPARAVLEAMESASQAPWAVNDLTR